MSAICGDNRFEIIEKAKKDILESTNIYMSPDEMKVLDNFLFRCWQMGWLKKYESDEPNYQHNSNSEAVSHGHWIYWEGWIGNHDMRIEDATCSECGYKHPAVRRDINGKRDKEAVLNKLANECPKCGAFMKKVTFDD